MADWMWFGRLLPLRFVFSGALLREACLAGGEVSTTPIVFGPALSWITGRGLPTVSLESHCHAGDDRNAQRGNR
ncbi:hypothetical protein E4V01_21065 [Methylorubrum sp. Q1]|uniref:hypothetical protein n=1 Tax=Methylorubrum sp. Q1 TaxID=2562453 RepID=UPI001076723A|nr:hypothetical protein [Methylorubrum sp. Q1]TFZ55826.1 hypothetical protein E4V01_21065 [Methylorubrum sp. Q1]